MDHTDYYETVKQILFEIGAIKTCDIHDDWFYSTGIEETKVYAIATKIYKQKYSNLDLIQIRDEIKQILGEAGNNERECPFCKKMMKE